MAPKYGGNWKDRLQDSKEAKSAASERLKALLPLKPRRSPAEPAAAVEQRLAISEPPPTPPAKPWVSVAAGTCPLGLQGRSAEETVSMQPWARALVDCVLRAAEHGGVTLALVWPARVIGLPILHALANVERVFQKDLRGIRTLLYPGTYASRAPLNAILAEKRHLSTFYQSLWEWKDSSSNVKCNTESSSFQAALAAMNDVHLKNPEVANPSLAELVPTFFFDPAKRSWAAMAANPLERTLSKVDRLATRKHLRSNVAQEWGEPTKAPGALLVLHRSTPKKQWQVALSHAALRGPNRPDVHLLDATRTALGGDPKALDAVPELLNAAREAHPSTGSVIVTDEPKSFFILRSLLHQAKIPFVAKQWAAEADDALLSSRPVPADWQPQARSNSNFSVAIVDKDASDVAIALQKIAFSAASPEAPAASALLAVARYVLRLSNLPAGTTDLGSTSEADDFSNRQNAWASVKLPLDEAIAAGVLNHAREQVSKAVTRAEKLIDAWSDSTPMGMRLLTQVRKDTLSARHGISIVLPSQRYVKVVQHFLRRKLGADWGTVEGRIDWHTLSTVGKTLAVSRSARHFLFVGINSDALRVLLTHPDVPHGSSVLVAYKQADATVKTLRSMKAVDEFKAYRGRIGLLAQELERRLAEVPNPIDIEKLREASFTFTFTSGEGGGDGGDASYYRFDLEGGGRAYASGWLFRYYADEDPPFRRAAASSIAIGDLIFDMSDSLRADVEESLQLTGDGLSAAIDPARVLLSLYHKAVKDRCQAMFSSSSQAGLAREIHAKMGSLDAKAKDCSLERVSYWLDLSDDGDTRPHASKDPRFFKLFCRALEMNDNSADEYWLFVRNARKASQAHGRMLISRYTEILFQPESAAIYRKLPVETIKRLQQEALHCVHRVEAITAPSQPATKGG